MPLEVEVSADPGLYSPQNVLDFGVLHSQSDPKTLPLFVINSSIKHIEIAVSYHLIVEICICLIKIGNRFEVGDLVFQNNNHFIV